MTVVWVASMSGCVLLDKLDRKDRPPRGTPCQIATTWEPQLVHGIDFANNGVKVPALVGRLYLFGKEVGTPMACEGTLTVQVFDLTHGEHPNPPLVDQPWVYNAEQLEERLQRDAIGWMYSIVLPSYKWHDGVCRIQVKAVFQPKGGGIPLYSESGSLTLSGVDPIQGVIQTSHVVGQPGNQPGGPPATRAPAAPSPDVTAAVRTLQQGGGMQPPTVPPVGAVATPPTVPPVGSAATSPTIPPDATVRNQFAPVTAPSGSPPPDVTAAIRTLTPQGPGAPAGLNQQQWTTPSQPSVTTPAPSGWPR